MKLHIVSFNVPFPANYGGVIDVFYKIKALHELGVEIILHCFEYGRTPADILENYCQTVHYYKRNTSILRQVSLTPYITNSRSSKALLQNLLKDDSPILFEGLHCCYFLAHKALKNRKKIVRMHNIEWEYYQHLAHLEANFIKKSFFLLESFRLKRFQNKLKYANRVLAISPQDFSKLNKNSQELKYISAFHPNEQVKSQVGQGNYVLFHADLSVKDNEEGAIFLINKVFKEGHIKMPFIIAGLNPSKKLNHLVSLYENISLQPNLSHEDLQSLIYNAHVNILISFQSAGMKLKLLNALFTGRFCLVNTPMVKDTGLEELCIVRNDYREIQRELSRLSLTPFQLSHVNHRRAQLGNEFFNSYNGKQIVEILE